MNKARILEAIKTLIRRAMETYNSIMKDMSKDCNSRTKKGLDNQIEAILKVSHNCRDSELDLTDKETIERLRGLANPIILAPEGVIDEVKNILSDNEIK